MATVVVRFVGPKGWSWYAGNAVLVIHDRWERPRDRGGPSWQTDASQVVLTVSLSDIAPEAQVGGQSPTSTQGTWWQLTKIPKKSPCTFPDEELAKRKGQKPPCHHFIAVGFWVNMPTSFLQHHVVPWPTSGIWNSLVNSNYKDDFVQREWDRNR